MILKTMTLFIFALATFSYGQLKYKGEFHISTETNRGQRNTEVGIASNGNFVVVWESFDQDGSDAGIYFQRYDSNGTKIGSETKANTETSLDQAGPDIAVAPNGDFVIVWESELQEGSTLGFGIYGQRFDSNGSGVGSEFHVNTFDSLDQQNTNIDMDKNGNFVVVWESYGQDPDSMSNVYGQMYDSVGVKIGLEFRVDTNTNLSGIAILRFPDVEVNLDGSFIVVWATRDLDGDQTGVFGQMFNSAGVKVGIEFQVNTTTATSQRYPSVASDSNGNFVVAWQSYSGAAGQNEQEVFAKRYNSSGDTLGTEFAVNTFRIDNQQFADVEMGSNGNFTIVWHSFGQDGDRNGVYGQRYDSQGVTVGSEFQINTYTIDDQESSAISVKEKGDFVVVWDSDEQDGSFSGVYGQMYKMRPSFSTLPEISFAEDSANKYPVSDYFPYVSDENDADAVLTWQVFNGNNVTTALSVNSDSITITPALNWFGSDSFMVVATDPSGFTDTTYQTVSVTAVNDAPVVADIQDQTINEGSSFAVISLDGFVSDVDNADSVMTWTYSGNTELVISIDANRVATISAPDTNWFGAETITFKATDPGALADSNAAIFTVTAVNDAPVVTDIPDQTIDEGTSFTTINLDDFVSDVDNSDAQMTWGFSGNTDLLVSIVNRVATISAPDTNWFGAEAITFTATDPGNLADSDESTFTVTNVNDAPVVADIPDQTIDEGSSFAVISLDNFVDDIDNTDAEMSWNYSGNTDLTVSINPVTRVAVISTPNSNWNGSETLTFTATDPGSLSDSDPATFTVTAINDPPVVSDIPDQSIAEGGTFSTINLDDYVSDIDNTDSEMTWTYSGNTDLIVSIDGSRVATITTPDVNWNGNETITFKATDPGALSDSNAATFTVSADNDPPIVSGIPDQIIEEGSTFATINLDDYVTDLDNTDAEMTWASNGNTELSVSIVNRVATITIPNEDWNGSESITFTATDPGGLSNSDAATFTVNAVNDAPVVSDIEDQTITEGESFVSIALDDFVSDIDNTDAEISWTYSGNTELTIFIDTNRVATITTPDVNWNGNDTITFIATDPGALADSNVAVFMVNAVNDAPVVDIADVSIREGNNFIPMNLDDYVTDVDNSDSEIVWSFSGNSNLSVSIDTNRVLTITVPDENWNGSETITFTATDPGALNASDSASFTVTAVNDAPEFVDLPEIVMMDDTSLVVLNLNDYVTDIDSPDSSFTWDFATDNDSLLFDFDTETAQLTLTALVFGGSVGLAITVFDDSSASAMDTILVEVTLVTALGDELANIVPARYSLEQNYPNPFNPTTKIRIGLPNAGKVKLEVFNVLGQKVATVFDEYKTAGYHIINFDASNFASGIYFYRIESKKFIKVRKMILMK